MKTRLGGIYRHYKGPRYRALLLVQDSNNDRNHEMSVVYVSLDPGPHQGQLNVRLETAFHEQVEIDRGDEPDVPRWAARFALIENKHTGKRQRGGRKNRMFKLLRKALSMGYFDRDETTRAEAERLVQLPEEK